MPIFVYACEPCQLSVEVWKKISEMERVEKCGTCEAEMRRQMTAPNVHFKGSGFYATDYKKPETKPATGDGGEAAPSGPGQFKWTYK